MKPASPILTSLSLLTLQFFALSTTLSQTIPSADNQSPQPGGQTLTPLEQIINPDGSVRLPARLRSGGDGEFRGALDVKGWQMHTSPDGKPRFLRSAGPSDISLAQGAVPEDSLWDGRFGPPGMNNTVYSHAVNGNDLYAGGEFTTAGGVSANYIARWSTSGGWSALGDGMNSFVLSLVTNGSDLYAGGGFTSAGGNSASRIAMWDGASWSALGSGVDGFVYALAVIGTDLYAGGAFTTAGGIVTNYVAKWDGTTWSALGGGMDGSVFALTVIPNGAGGTDLYAGGFFTTAGGNSANNIAKWDGTSWSALGSGMDAAVNTLTVIPNGAGGTDLYAGGFFTVAGGVGVSHIAMWDGISWSPLGTGMNNNVNSLTAIPNGAGGSDLYAGGLFTTAGGVSATYVAKWNGASWSALGGGVNSIVNALAAIDTSLYAGGLFITAGGIGTNYIARWNGATWSALGSGMNDPVYCTVYALAVSGTDLYAGGAFTTAGGVSANNIARWDGASWSALGSGMDNDVNALAVIGTDLYAGGDFTTAGGVSASYIARWDGTNWSALGSGMDNDVNALAVIGTDLYAGGDFATAGGVSANNIAIWSGNWLPLGSGMNNSVYALGVIGTDLYAGGNFTTAGGVSANNIARWNGNWLPLGSGMDNDVKALALIPNGAGGTDLYAGGNFTTAGGVSANYIARWDGTSWSALGSAVNSSVHALSVIGTDLYAGGHFTTAGGDSANRIARWDGAGWSALGSGMNGEVNALGVTGTDLYVGGPFTTAGGKPSAYLGQWHIPGVTGVIGTIPTIPAGYGLSQNYPNPFNPTTTIRYHLPAGQAGITDYRFVVLGIYNVLGQRVAELVNDRKYAGTYDVTWDATGQPSGVYFYRLQTHPIGSDQAGGFVETKKLLFLK